MIRLIQRRLIVPRGDTGTFSIPVLAGKDTGDVSIFTVFDPLMHRKIFEKVMTLSGETLTMELTHGDTVNLPVGQYVWDIKFYTDPIFAEEKLIGGTEVDSYYAAFTLPICEIRETGDNLLMSDDAPTGALKPGQIDFVTASINEMTSLKNTTTIRAAEADTSAQNAANSAQDALVSQQAAQTAASNAEASAELAAQKAAEIAADLSGKADKSEIPTKVSELANDAGYITGYTEIDPTVPAWAKAAAKPAYTAAEVGAPTVQEMNSAISTAIGNVNSFDMVVVQTLPTQDINTHTIYLVPKTGETNDVYNEYIYINNAWEMIGNTQIDLSNYATKNEVTALIDDTASVGDTDVTFSADKLTAMDSALKNAIERKFGVSNLKADGGLQVETDIETGKNYLVTEVYGDTIAPSYFDLTFPVKQGQYCYFGRNLWIANTEIASQEYFNRHHWTQVDVGTSLDAKEDKPDLTLTFNLSYDYELSVWAVTTDKTPTEVKQIIDSGKKVKAIVKVNTGTSSSPIISIVEGTPFLKASRTTSNVVLSVTLFVSGTYTIYIQGLIASDKWFANVKIIIETDNYSDYVPMNRKRVTSVASPVDDTDATNKQYVDTLVANKIDISQKGAANGVAELDSAGKVPAAQLPSYVDDVQTYETRSAFPQTGEDGIIYVAKDTNTTYRWGGSDYVAIGSDLALGETASTAYRGDRGKIAYEHATAKGSAFASGLYKIATNAEGHVTGATPVTKKDIIDMGIPGAVADVIDDTAASTSKTFSSSKLETQREELLSAINEKFGRENIGDGLDVEYDETGEATVIADVQRSDITNLQQNKADIIITNASGSIAAITDGADDLPIEDMTVQIEPVQDLHGQSNPYPGGGGKNLITITEYYGGYNKTANTNLKTPSTAVVTENANVITITSTGSWQGRLFATSMLPAGTYTVHVEFSDADARAATYTTDSELIVITNEGNSTSTIAEKIITITEPRRIAITLVNSAAKTNTYTNLQVESGQSYTSWTSYSNICPISGWTGCKVTRTGKNLFDGVIEPGYMYTDTGTNVSSNTAYRSKNYIPIKPGESYYLKLDSHALQAGKTSRVFFYGIDKQFISTPGASASSRIVSAPNNAYFMRFFVVDPIENASGDISVNYPSTDTDYHAYQGSTYPITFPSEAGTVYGGTLNPVTGELVVDRMMVQIRAAQNRSVDANNNYFWYSTSITLGIPNIKELNAKLISNRMTKYSNVTNVSPEGNITYYANGIIRWKEQGTLTLSEYNSYLSENPLEICYEIANPTTYTLTPTEIRTLLGTNNIWADTGDVSVDYRADTKLYVERMSGSGAVSDVKVNGSSVVQNGIANVPLASTSAPGVAKVSSNFGTNMYNGIMFLAKATDAEIKAGTKDYKPIVSYNQHLAAFYGLAKAAGDSTQAASDNVVGIYTSEAKGSIQKMLGITDLIATAENNLVASKAYKVGDVFTANGKLYKTTAAIAADAAIIPVVEGEEITGANCVETSVGEGFPHDVQVNGESVVNNGVANIPYANISQAGVIKLTFDYGLTRVYKHESGSDVATFEAGINAADSALIKEGAHVFRPIVPKRQHEAVFYGLAKAAGDATQSASSNAVGTYTEEAKTAIKQMLGVQDGLKVVRLI